MSKPQPALQPTQPATLVVAGLAAAALAWLLISNYYQDLPPMIWPPVVVIGGLAGFEGLVAQNLWARIHRRGRVFVGRRGPGGEFEPVEPLTVARFAVLAKASAVAGALFTGFYAGYLPWLLAESARVAGAQADLPPTVGGLAASAILMAAAMWLERACRVPEPPEDEDRSRDRPDA